MNRFVFSRFVCLALPFMLLVATACGDIKPETSEVDALTNKTLSCMDYSPATLQKLDAEIKAVPGFFNNFSAADQTNLLKHLQSVPPAYRNQLFALKKAGIFRGFFKRDLGGSGVMGTCTSTNQGPREIAITSRFPNAIGFAFIHEVGHGVEGIIQRKAGINNRQWETTIRGLMQEASLYNRGSTGVRADQVRDYALTSDAEFFAEAFHNYYCSPATNGFIEKNLPRTYAFLKSVLETPVWFNEQPSQPTPMPEIPAPSNLELRATQHTSAILQAFNNKSTRCDLNLKSIGSVESNGDFRFDVSAILSNGTSLPAVRFITNFNNSQGNELRDLESLVPRFFQNCALN